MAEETDEKKKVSRGNSLCIVFTIISLEFSATWKGQGTGFRSTQSLKRYKSDQALAKTSPQRPNPHQPQILQVLTSQLENLTSQDIRFFFFIPITSILQFT
ncbi:hypothetical protein Csa_014740 [Cucumis sativus]|uniref:Uncharacterized protein n=1 Tax=Cucumis sativus TaxID=3659 RepID=A0A0A0KUL4_CUCSA|nr:hypothetical protein Csa_014740 [Cucumis sativus]